MSTRSHRLLVVGCMLSWFLLGMHVPIVHEITGHGRIPGPSVLLAVAAIVLAALAAAWALLRAPAADRER
jgi:hypothetical protein